jgi:hypothetical protein
VIRPKDTILIGTPGKVPANPVAAASSSIAAKAPPISPEMKQLLDKKLPEVNFAAVSLSDAIDFLRDVTNANIVVAWNAIEGAGLGRNTPVTVRVRDVSVAKGLELVLDAASTNQVKIRYTVDENVIRIAPVTQAENASKSIPTPPRPEPAPAAQIDPKTKAMLDRDLPEVNFDNVALSDVIDFLRDITNANIFVNWNALQAAGIDRNSPVTLRLRNVAFGKVIELLLDAVSGGTNTKLAYTVDQGVISISAVPAQHSVGATADTEKAAHRAALEQAEVYLRELQAQGLGDNSANVIRTKKLIDSLQRDLQLPTSAPATPSTQAAPYRAVRIVVSPEKMTLEGKETTWEEAKKTLLELPNRGECVLEVAVASDQMTLKQQQDALGKGRALANELKFKYLSDVGVEPLGSKGGEPHKLTATQSRRQWDQPPDLSKGGEYYVSGHVKRTGVYSFTGGPVRLRQALSAAGIEDGKWVVQIVGRNPDRTEETLKLAIDTSDLKKKDAANDPYLRPNDQVTVSPIKEGKNGEKVYAAPTTKAS